MVGLLNRIKNPHTQHKEKYQENTPVTYSYRHLCNFRRLTAVLIELWAWLNRALNLLKKSNWSANKSKTPTFYALPYSQFFFGMFLELLLEGGVYFLLIRNYAWGFTMNRTIKKPCNDHKINKDFAEDDFLFICWFLYLMMTVRELHKQIFFFFK